MRQKRYIETCLTIEYPVLTMSDPIKNLKAECVKLFTNKCYKEQYIHEVTKIVEYSNCKSVQKNGSYDNIIDVVFEADTTIIYTGELITNCEVVYTNEQRRILSGTSGIYSIFADYSNINNIKVGMIIPIVCGGVKYRIGSDRVAINASIYTPNKYNRGLRAYKITDKPYTPEELELLETFAAKYKEEHARAAKIRKKSNNMAQAWDTFNGYTHTYEDGGEDFGEDILNLMSTHEPIAGVYMRHPRIKNESPNLSQNDTEDIPHINIPRIQALQYLFNDVLTDLSLINNLTEQYSTSQKVYNDHKPLLKYFKSQQLPKP